MKEKIGYNPRRGCTKKTQQHHSFIPKCGRRKYPGPKETLWM